MREKLELGPVPYEEPCQQLGPNYDAVAAKHECNRYCNQLVRQFGKPPAGVSVSVRGFAHDFGTYYEACVLFDPDSEEQTEYAYKLESDGPANWDETALAEIKAIDSRSEVYGKDAERL